MLSAQVVTQSFDRESNEGLHACSATRSIKQGQYCCSANGDDHQDILLDLLLTCAAKQGHKVPEDVHQRERLLGGLSHLQLNGLQLKALHNLRLCPKLQVRTWLGHCRLLDKSAQLQFVVCCLVLPQHFSHHTAPQGCPAFAACNQPLSLRWLYLQICGMHSTRALPPLCGVLTGVVHI